MKKIENLRDLFVEQGREVYDALRQEEKALPEIEKKAQNADLKKIVRHQIDTVKSQRMQLENAFNSMNVGLEGEKNSCCESIIRRTMSLIDRSTRPEVRDAIIINSTQRLNHLKITGLGSLAAYANQIQERDVAQGIHDALEDEWDIDRHLSRLAEKEINVQASRRLAV